MEWCTSSVFILSLSLFVSINSKNIGPGSRLDILSTNTVLLTPSDVVIRFQQKIDNKKSASVLNDEEAVTGSNQFRKVIFL